MIIEIKEIVSNGLNITYVCEPSNPQVHPVLLRDVCIFPHEHSFIKVNGVSITPNLVDKFLDDISEKDWSGPYWVKKTSGTLDIKKGD